MALVGIDFGTTNTVVALHDRGSFPVLGHTIDSRAGRIRQPVYPSVSVLDPATGKLVHGLAAERAAGQSGDAPVLRSLKRLLNGASDDTTVRIGDRKVGIRACLAEFLQSLAASIRVSAALEPGETIEAVVTWPAQGNGAMRALLRAAFGDAGITLVGSLNEPTAAAVEFADRVTGGNPRQVRKLERTLAVFDFGGGTLDVSLVSVIKGRFEVLGSLGDANLGGDDLDAVMARLLAEKLGRTYDDLSPRDRAALNRHARALKESVASSPARRLMLDPQDLGWTGSPVSVTVGAFEEAARPLVERAVDCLATLLQRWAASGQSAASAVYLVGGSSQLPLVSRVLTERLPQLEQVASHQPFSSVAVGAAIHATGRHDVREVFARHFGVLRLADEGRREVFSPIFRAGTKLPSRGEPPLHHIQRYSPRHDLGHLRYLECSDLTTDGKPAGSVRAWSDVLFPYEPSLAPDQALDGHRVQARPDLAHAWVEERYSCDADGVITVEMERLSDRRQRRFEIFHR